MISTIIKKLFGTTHDREVRRLQPLVEKLGYTPIGSYESYYYPPAS